MAIHITPKVQPQSAGYRSPDVIEIAAHRHRPWKAKHHPTMVEWIEVRRLHNEGISVRAISRTVRLSQRSVRHVLYPWPRS